MNQHKNMSNNEATSAREKLYAVLKDLEQRGDELRAVLPRDITLDSFLANVNQALRNNPKLLRCTYDSIINACVKSAYDGLRIDGKEAAIIDSKERYKDGNVWKDRDVARYMPMVFGLIKQILDSGAALTVKAVIVYENELKTINPADGKPHFMLLEGTTPGIHHSPILIGAKGDPIGCYAIAEVVRGVFKFEWMDRLGIQDIQKEAKTKVVWERWWSAMWKKTVIRQLRKSLNGASKIRDMEASEMFAQFDRTSAHPQLAAPAPARPTRAAIANQSGTESGTPMNFGHDADGVVVDDDRQQEQQQRGGAQQEQQQQKRADPPKEENREPDVQLPEDEAAWAVWGVETEKRIAEAKTDAECDMIFEDIRPVATQATKAIRERLTSLFTDRRTELALDTASGAAAGNAE